MSLALPAPFGWLFLRVAASFATGHLALLTLRGTRSLVNARSLGFIVRSIFEGGSGFVSGLADFLVVGGLLSWMHFRILLPLLLLVFAVLRVLDGVYRWRGRRSAVLRQGIVRVLNGLRAHLLDVVLLRVISVGFVIFHRPAFCSLGFLGVLLGVLLRVLLGFVSHRILSLWFHLRVLLVQVFLRQAPGCIHLLCGGGDWILVVLVWAGLSGSLFFCLFRRFCLGFLRVLLLRFLLGFLICFLLRLSSLLWGRFLRRFRRLRLRRTGLDITFLLGLRFLVG
mmetsp:Transcript_22734/g.45726  ORF Transcript_22734/g.45726 Transcript_22734/m.45726 type:complete len:281 (-) Transcript_22734:1085-1927(-)